MKYIEYIGTKYSEAFTNEEIGIIPKHEHFHKWHEENMDKLVKEYETEKDEIKNLIYKDIDEDLIEEVKCHLRCRDENIDMDWFWSEFPIEVDKKILSNASKCSNYMNRREYSSFYFCLYLCEWLCSEHESEAKKLVW